MHKKRDIVIDILRGLAILTIMLMHVQAYYLSNSTIAILWNFSQWVVPTILLASVAVMPSPRATITFAEYTRYLSKRLKRLLIPYWISIGIYFFLQYLTPGNAMSPLAIAGNIFLFGGIDYNWLVLLFIYLTAFLPLLDTIYLRSKYLYLTLFVFFCGISLLYSFDRTFITTYSRIFMLPTWLAIAMLCRIVLDWYRARQWSYITALAVLSAAAFFTYFVTVVTQGSNAVFLFKHKYPPDTVFVTYSALSISLALLLGRSLVKLLLHADRLGRPFIRFLTYLSKHSYEFYFIHVLVLFFLDRNTFGSRPTYLMMTVLLLVPTFLIQISLRGISEATSRRLASSRNMS